MPIEIYMPKMSDHMETGIIIGWLVKEGERVTSGQPIVEVETDKTVAEIEAPAAGFIKGIRGGTAKGDAVPVGETIAFLASAADETVPSLPPISGSASVVAGVTPAEPTPSEPQAAVVPGGPVRSTPFVRKRTADLGVDLAQIAGTGPAGRITEADLDVFLAAQARQQPAIAPQADEAVRATPFVRKRARELGIDLAKVTGSGQNGRVSEDDLNAFLQSQPAPTQPAAAPRAVAPADDSWLDLSKIQRVTGERMTLSAQTVPQFNLTVEADATNLLALRELIARKGTEKVSVTALLVVVVADALRRLPRANASFVDGRLKLHSHVNIGVAVGSEEGLLVPVIHDADHMIAVQIQAQLAGFREKASRGRFAADDLMGGTFTISNLGMYGIRQFNAIVNPPESAILAVGAIVYQPICLPDRTIAVRPTISLTLTVDHRSLDGMVAAMVLSAIMEGVEQPMVLSLDRLVGSVG